MSIDKSKAYACCTRICVKDGSSVSQIFSVLRNVKKFIDDIPTSARYPATLRYEWYVYPIEATYLHRTHIDMSSFHTLDGARPVAYSIGDAIVYNELHPVYAELFSTQTK